jgi:hypothetical protein
VPASPLVRPSAGGQHGTVFARRLRAIVLLAAVLLLAPRQSYADSVADKANARTLATEGIDLYNEGSYPEALDRLQRAQQLFDAPIHLLYMARAQAKLGQLVEATETYRRLIRVELSADTPAAVREAVESADAELDGVDARVAAVRIEVVPPAATGLTLRIDGQPVSAAVVGVDRPLNPGPHQIEAELPDGRQAATSLELSEGQRRLVRLEFGAASDVRDVRTPVLAEPAVAAVPAPAAVSFFAGAGVGLSLPFGELRAGVPISRYASAGVGLEVRAGLRFARYFGAKLFVDGALLSATSPKNEEFDTEGSAVGDQFEVELATSAQSIGLSLLVGSPARGLGGFGELGLVFQRLAIRRDFTQLAGSMPADGMPAVACGSSFSQTLALTGAAIRVGGGATIPLSDLLELTPFAHGTFGRFSQSALDSGCSGQAGPSGLGDDLPSDRRGTHAQVLIGIGGNFVFGQR